MHLDRDETIMTMHSRYKDAERNYVKMLDQRAKEFAQSLGLNPGDNVSRIFKNGVQFPKLTFVRFEVDKETLELNIVCTNPAMLMRLTRERYLDLKQ